MDDGFKTIEGFENYEINRKGIVRRKKTDRKPAKIIRCGFNKHYYHVTLYNSRGCKTIDIHKLVATIFIENPNPSLYTVINHKDGNKRNNSVDNLEWCNTLYNVNHESTKNTMIKKIKEANNIKVYTYDINYNETIYDSLSSLADILNINS